MQIGISMAKGNFREYLQGEWVKTKKYFYVLRPILACQWIETKNTMPPMEFEVLVNELITNVSLKAEIARLLQRKKSGEEFNLEPRIELIHDYLRMEISHLEEYLQSVAKEEPVPEAKFNQLFQDALTEIWGSVHESGRIRK